MIKRLLVSAVLAGAALAVPVTASAAASTPAVTAVQAAHVTAAHACTYGRSGNTWRCITPGAYCPAAAHGRYGYAKTTGKRYKCTQYTRTTWRWKRA